VAGGSLLPVTSRGRLRALSRRQRETYARALHARRLMERAGMSREQAAREAGTSVRTIKRYLGDAVEKRGGRWRVRAKARLYSYVRVPTTSGIRTLEASAREAALARDYKDALWRWANTGDDSALAAMEGAVIDGHVLETDLAVLGELLDRGELDIYEIGSGETARV
jgi:hypothetical protein